MSETQDNYSLRKQLSFLGVLELSPLAGFNATQKDKNVSQVYHCAVTSLTYKGISEIRPQSDHRCRGICIF